MDISSLFYSQLHQNDITILQLYHAEKVVQSDLDQILHDCKTEDFSMERKYLLSFLQSKYPDLTFPPSLRSEIDKVKHFIQKKNVTLVMGLQEVARELNRKNIPFMLMKGIAMKFLFPGKLRNMYDVDFYVPEKFFDETIQTAVDLGFTPQDYFIEHSKDLTKGEVAIDVHKTMFKWRKNVQEMEAQIFADAPDTALFGIKVRMPLIEELLLITMWNEQYNFIETTFIEMTETKRNIFWLFDTARIIESYPQFDWERFFANAAKIGLLNEVKLMLNVFDDLLPGRLPKHLSVELQQNQRDIDLKVEFSLVEEIFNSHWWEWNYINEKKSLQDYITYSKVWMIHNFILGAKKIPFLFRPFADASIKYFVNHNNKRDIGVA